MTEQTNEPTEAERMFVSLERFRAVVLHAFDHRKFVAAFDGLTGSNLLGRGSPLDRMVDEATGRFETDARKFIEFVHETVWTRCPALHEERSWRSQ
jgi:hypothetical protein